MNIEQMSDRKLEDDRNLMLKWIATATPEEHESGEVKSWDDHLKLINVEIKQRQEQGKETR
jgi:hypothetical protein